MTSLKVIAKIIQIPQKKSKPYTNACYKNKTREREKS